MRPRLPLDQPVPTPTVRRSSDTGPRCEIRVCEWLEFALAAVCGPPYDAIASVLHRIHMVSSKAGADNWQVTDSTDWAQLVWAPCGVQRNFNINTELRVAAGTSSASRVSFMTMDSTDGDISTVYHLAWKECPAS